MGYDVLPYHHFSGQPVRVFGSWPTFDAQETSNFQVSMYPILIYIPIDGLLWHLSALNQGWTHHDLTGARLPPGIPARFRTSDASAVRWCSGPVGGRRKRVLFLRTPFGCPSDQNISETGLFRKTPIGAEKDILALQRASGSIVGQQVSKPFQACSNL